MANALTTYSLGLATGSVAALVDKDTDGNLTIPVRRWGTTPGGIFVAEGTRTNYNLIDLTTLAAGASTDTVGSGWTPTTSQTMAFQPSLVLVTLTVTYGATITAAPTCALYTKGARGWDTNVFAQFDLDDYAAGDTYQKTVALRPSIGAAVAAAAVVTNNDSSNALGQVYVDLQVSA